MKLMEGLSDVTKHMTKLQTHLRLTLTDTQRSDT